MTIDKVHTRLDFEVNKSSGSWFSPPEKDDALDQAQMDYFTQCFGNPMQYQPGRYTPSISLGVSQKINDTLSPFKKTASFTSDSTGIVTLPSDYIHLLALNTVENVDGTNYRRAVRIINEDQLINRLNSVVCPVLQSDPIGIINSEKKIQLFPEVAQVGKVYYLRRPLKPIYAYTMVNNRPVYTSVGSVDLEWDEPSVNIIMYKALQLLGVNLKDADVVSFNQQKEVRGV